jgi:sarcosine oxidase
MPTRWDAIVVGAGISGLAAAYELARRQRRVLVLEAAGVGAAQSAGLARIFRVAHADPRLCALALEAMRGWRRWESELGTGRLLGGEGLVVAGSERAASYRAAMNAAGAPSAPLDRAAVAARLPLLAPDHPWDGGLWDPLAGSLRIRRALAALARRVTVRRATVVAVEPEGAVRLDDGSTPAAAAVVVCAGLATGPLVAPLGLDVGVDARHHVRLTYQMRAPVATACLIAPEAYALPLGSTGRFAVGMRDEDGGWPLGAIGDDEAATAVRRQHAAWVPRVFPGLAAEPVGDVRCVSLEADWIGPAGDGFVAERSGPVIAFGASNVMKFGPLVGERLAAMALGDDRGVHPDLRRSSPSLPAPRSSSSSAPSRSSWD